MNLLIIGPIGNALGRPLWNAVPWSLQLQLPDSAEGRGRLHSPVTVGSRSDYDGTVAVAACLIFCSDRMVVQAFRRRSTILLGD